ncbi:MAG TPA: YggT family protein [Anaerolineales bacterium]
MPDEIRVSEVKATQQEPEREQRILTFKLTELVWLLLGLLEAAIALRIGLKLIGANPGSPIVAFIYGLTELFLFPFTGMVQSPTFGNMELEISSMFAMLIYGLLGWAAERLVWLIFYRPRGPVVATTQTTTSEHRDIR